MYCAYLFDSYGYDCIFYGESYTSIERIYDSSERMGRIYRHQQGEKNDKQAEMEE